MDLSKICEAVREISEQAAAYVRDQREGFRPEMIEHKGFNDLVSYVDKQTEQFLVSELSRLIPDAGFITEENTRNEQKERFNWIIDPLDGTTNYIHGITPYAISIALMEREDVVVGIVNEVGLAEVFYSWKGGPALLNGRPIRVSQTSLLAQSLLATGFPYQDFNKLGAFMESLSVFMKKTHGIRRLGSAATDLAYVAAGRFEAFYEYGLNPWDVAAGAFLVQQAGGKVCDFSGGPGWLFGKEIVASNDLIFQDFLAEVTHLLG